MTKAAEVVADYDRQFASIRHCGETITRVIGAVFKILFGVAIGVALVLFWPAVAWSAQLVVIYILVLGPFIGGAIYLDRRLRH